MSDLAHAIALAARAHEGKKDKAGEPYILHPLRMMFRLVGVEERIVAVLHDVVEDTEWSLDGLRREGFSETVVDAVDAMTHRKGEGETYEAFVKRAAANPMARRVKLADLEDNSDLSRIPNPTEKDFERLEKYRKATAAILALEGTGAAGT